LFAIKLAGEWRWSGDVPGLVLTHRETTLSGKFGKSAGLGGERGAEVFGSLDALAPYMQATVQLLFEQVAAVFAGGGRAILAPAVDAAAQLVEEGAARGQTTNRTRVLILLTSTHDACVLTKCVSKSDGPCTCTTSTLAAVRARLGFLESSLNGSPVTVMALTFGNVDDAVVRELTCICQTSTQGLTVPMAASAGNVISAAGPATC